jgi:hypothetical protein
MDGSAASSESIALRRLRWARVVLLVQGLALLVVIGEAAPSFLDQLFHAPKCEPNQMCIDLRGLFFELSVVFLGPPALLLFATAWIWRRPRTWPAAVPLVLDVVLIGLVISDVFTVARSGYDEFPPILVQVLLGLVPAAVSLALTLLVLRRAAT